MNRHVLGAVLAAVSLAVVAGTPAAAAAATQPPLEIEKLRYEPIGHLKPGQPLAPADGCASVMQPLRQGEVFNPSGTFNAFDSNVFEVLCYPFRGPGDTTSDDPLGNKGATLHGRCGGAYEPSSADGREYGTWAPISGVCDNHQLEWSRYYAATMREILGDFGVTVHQYAFEVEDPGLTGNTRYGRAINTAAVVPGADDPDETVIVGAHYDKTNDAPASAWDSQEGHAEMIRMAKLMADYWRATGTRPSATVKFIPWDAEESGTFGSLDYATNNVVPGEEFKVRGYWNTDPCAGGYPSFRYGNPADRLRMGIQLADPGAIGGIGAADATRITEFNRRAPQLVQQVLDHLDDTVPTLAGPVEVFRSDAEGDGDVGKVGGIAIGSDRPILFSSDWRNFEVLGIPFFNPGPEVTGPNQNTDGSIDYGIDQSADALAAFHTPLDNLSQLMRFTGGGLAGDTYSESWAKGMEFCSHLLSWGMLQHDQGGAQTADKDVVAYYEALPNEAREDQAVSFDAGGSHQLAETSTRRMVPEAELEFRWDFGDGETGSGRRVDHAYTSAGRYESALTVRNRRTGASSTMRVPITVLPNDVAPPVLEAPAATDEDGTFDLRFDYRGSRAGLTGFSVEESTNAVSAIDDRAETLDRWEVVAPTEGSIQPWQLSDSATPKYFGNRASSEPRGFWTGVRPADQAYEAGASEGESMLVLKDSVQLPRGANASLFYSSAFVNGGADVGRVQVAIDAPGTPLEWVTVDTVKAGSEDADSLSRFEEVQSDDSFPGMAARFADVSRFAGRRIKVRFVYALGEPDAAPFGSSRTGWYVDDVRLVGGTFREIGQTSQRTFTVSGKRKGAYTYRVKALFADAVKSSGSNAEAVRVTVGAPDAASPCAAAAGFSRAGVTPRGRGLRFTLGLTGSPATVELFRATRGSRVTRARVARWRRSASFTWRGRSLAPGLYYARLTTRAPDGRGDSRFVTLRRTRSGFRRAPAFRRPDSCALLSRARLGHPAFDRRGLAIQYAVTQPAKVSVAVFRAGSKRAVRRWRARPARANRPVTLRLGARGLRRGEYRVVITAVKGRERARTTLRSRRV